jgi:DNA-directed RNA polymerase subunit RPC12/RpoP
LISTAVFNAIAGHPMRAERRERPGRLQSKPDTQIVACPKCNARVFFHRSNAPRFDACGFESYSFDCRQCGAALGGIVDPSDDMLLIAERAA